MLKNYLKIAWRNLAKNKLSSLINGIGLSIGISACMVILIFVKYETTFDAYHPNADQTYRVVQHNKLPNETLYWNTTAYPLAAALRDDFPEISTVTQTAGPVSPEFTITTKAGELQKFEESQLLFVDPYFPEAFSISWLSGNPKTALTGVNSVVLTEFLAQKYFGVTASQYDTILGKTILLQHKDPLTVTGVIEDVPGNSNQRYRMLIPYEFFRVNNPYFSANWSGNYQGTTFVVLQDQTLKNPLEAKIATWKKKYLNPEDDQRISYKLQALTDIHNETLYGSSPGGYTFPSSILNTAAIIAFFILLIAIVNFVNLLTAQSVSRSKEVGVRKVLGSNRWELVLQFIFENSLLILATLTTAIVLVNFLLKKLNAYLTLIDLKLILGWYHIGLILFIGILTILLAAIYPAIVLTAFKPIEVLKNRIQIRTKGGFGLRRTLIIIQFVIVQLFVIAAIIVWAQMNYFNNGALGFSSDSTIVTSSPDFSKLEAYRNSLLSESKITKVSFGSGPPMAVNGLQLGTSYRLPSQNPDEALNAEMKVADANYIDFYNLELLSGKNFSVNKEAFDEFIVNETFLKSYGWNPQEALGKRIQINEGEATIIGVVKDFHNNSLQYEITPCIMLNWAYYQNNAFIKIENGDYSVLSTIKTTWESTFSNALYKYQFLDDSIAKEYAIEHLIAQGFGIFSVLAISIGCLGLFGLMSFVISRKTKEIGIRKVLGANFYETLGIFTKEFIGLIALAFVIATPIVYHFLNIWLEGFTYRISLSIWMFLSGGLLTLGIAVISCSFQTIRASLANPIDALREE